VSAKVKESTNLSPGQITALSAILARKSYGEAAELAGVSVACLRKWRLQPEFNDALEAGLQSLMDEALTHGRALIAEAIGVLGEEMRDADKSGERQAAANSILDRFKIPKSSAVETKDTTERTPAVGKDNARGKVQGLRLVKSG
jgi:hypothetical protein